MYLYYYYSCFNYPQTIIFIPNGKKMVIHNVLYMKTVGLSRIFRSTDRYLLVDQKSKLGRNPTQSRHGLGNFLSFIFAFYAQSFYLVKKKIKYNFHEWTFIYY